MTAAPGRPIASYLRPYRAQLALGVVLLLVTNAFDKSIPWLLQHAIDALRDQDLAACRDFAVVVVGVAAVMWVVRTWSRIVVFNVGRDVEFDLRNELVDRVHMLGTSFFRRMATGEIMSRATNDVGQVRLLVGFGLLNVINAGFAYVGAVGLMLSISPVLTLYSMVPYPLFVLVSRQLSRALYTRSQTSQAALGQLSARAQENISGLRVVRAFAVEEHEQRLFSKANQHALKQNMRLVVVRGVMWPVLMGLSSIGTLIVVFKGGSMVVEGELTVGQFAAFSAYLGQLVWPTLAFGFLLSVVQRGRASYQRVREVLDADPDVQDAPAALPLTQARGALRVEGLSFDYGQARVLDDVSLSVPAAGLLAVVGRTGSGKSTLTALLARMLPTPEHSVFLDDHDVTRLRLADLRRNLAVAQQEPFLFSASVASNIGFALEDPAAPGGMERVRDAAREAAVLDDIEGLPEGFDTVVGERGVQLSGGQKQRVALARALLSEPRVLVLDDPLSAVDARTEAQILSALAREGDRGRTVVLVTHRVAAARRADSIVVLDGGRVIERGTHEELMATGGVYADLARRQSLEQELSGL